MSQAHNALSLSIATNTTLDNRLKLLLRAVACDDCIICFKDGSYLVYEFSQQSWRFDKLRVETCQDDLPFCPVDVDLLDLSK